MTYHRGSLAIGPGRITCDQVVGYPGPLHDPVTCTEAVVGGVTAASMRSHARRRGWQFSRNISADYCPRHRKPGRC